MVYEKMKNEEKYAGRNTMRDIENSNFEIMIELI